jgi:hypothetical protein
MARPLRILYEGAFYHAKGTLLTELNYYNIEVVIPESETLKEVLSPI